MVRKKTKRKQKPKPPPNRVRDFRRAAGLTQVAAAKRAGISQAMWQVWESSDDLEVRTVGTVRLIAWTLGVTLSDLLDV